MSTTTSQKPYGLTDSAHNVMRVARDTARKQNFFAPRTYHILRALTENVPQCSTSLLDSLEIRHKVFGSTYFITEHEDCGMYNLLLEAAKKLARAWNHNYVGTEHLLVACMSNPEFQSYKILSSLGQTESSFKYAVENMLGI